MKATALLKKQHRLVDHLFEKFEKAKASEQIAVFEEIAANLVAHDAIERELFYPACDQALGKEDILNESLVEHGVVEFCLFRADQHRKRDEFESYVKVLKEVVKHHVDEEEDELLPKVERAMDDEQLETLGAEMEERFEAALEANFRAALRRNLQQVMSGRTRTTKAKSGMAKARPTSAKKKRVA